MTYRLPHCPAFLLLAMMFAVNVGFAAQSSICYVRPGGDDAKDGGYWPSAKADVMACYDALPREGGTIYINDDGGRGQGARTCGPGEPEGCGIWIMGHRDPNYAHPPAGWRRSKRAVNFIGVGGGAGAAFSLGQQVRLAGGGHDAKHPNIWLSDVFSHRFENLALVYGHSPVYLGIDSNNSRSNVNISAWDWFFGNVSAGPSSKPGFGPAVTIGTNSDWGFFRDCSLSGNPAESVKIRSLARSRGTVTVTAAGAFPTSWSGTMNIGIAGASDASFNGIARATISAPATLTYAQHGPDAAAHGGMASSDQAQAVVINPAGRANPGSGLLFVETTWLSGGGIRAYAGTSGVGLSVRDTWQENGYAPPIDVLGCPVPTGAWAGNGVRVSNIQIADSSIPLPGLRIDAPRCGVYSVAQMTSVEGPASLAGGAGPLSPHTLPSAAGQSGIYANRVFAQVDTPRRAFGPVASRYANLARQDPAAWGTQPPGGACPERKAGRPAPAPDGTMNAGAVFAESGAVACFYSRAKDLRVGDWVVAGAWARSAHANGFTRNAAIQLACSACTFTPGTSYVFSTATPGGGGEWDWVWVAAQVTASSGSNSLQFIGNVDAAHPADFFAPVFIHIPAGTVTANEAGEIALHLQSYREGAEAGQVSLLRGEQFKADSFQIGDGPTLTSGDGPPHGPGSPGSIYLRRDGPAGSTFYLYEKDGWKAKF